MTDSIKSWRPNLPDRHGSEGLTVPYSAPQPMSRELYELLQRQQLKKLIGKNPEQAKSVLTSSPELLPDLYQIALQNDPEDWPPHILACDQMRTLLDQIDWSKGTSLNLSPSELPTLEQITEALPQ